VSNIKAVWQDFHTMVDSFPSMSRDAQVSFLLDFGAHYTAANKEIANLLDFAAAFKALSKLQVGWADSKIGQVMDKLTDILTSLKLGFDAGNDYLSGLNALVAAEKEAKSWRPKVRALREKMYAIQRECQDRCNRQPKDDDCDPDPPEDPEGGEKNDHQKLITRMSLDPNAKWTTGVGEQGWIRPGTPIVYTILFENQPQATAPAQEVRVRDALAPQLDAASLELLEVAFNTRTFTPSPGRSAWRTRTTVSTDPYPVEAEAGVDQLTGELRAYFRSVDALTGELPADTLAGFLPPNDELHRGEGHLSFAIHPLADLPDGTVITNRAMIVFDVNEPIWTETTVNTIDGAPPHSRVTADSAPASALFPVQRSGDDGAGSGVAAYEVYVAVDGGPFTPWLSGVTNTSATFFGQTGHQYGFFSLARDRVGNVEPMKTEPDVVVTPTFAGLTYAQWLAEHFAADDLADPAREADLWGEAADPDQDGVANLLEYLAGRNPWEADGGAVLEARVADGKFLLSYRRSKAAVEGAYQVEWSTDLQSWHPEGIVETPVTDDGEVWRLEAGTILDQDEALFLRLRATR